MIPFAVKVIAVTRRYTAAQLTCPSRQGDWGAQIIKQPQKRLWEVGIWLHSHILTPETAQCYCTPAGF